MLRLAETRDEVGVVSDQRGCPTSAADLAQAIATTVPTLDRASPYGAYHLAGATETNWHEFAEAIFTGLSTRGLKRPQNRAIDTSAYPTPATRPMNSRLASARFAEAFGKSLPPWEESLPKVLDEILGGQARG
jgi:dTDP-4-dehydrorhamnose reductase